MVASGILLYFNFVTPFTSFEKKILNSHLFVKYFVIFLKIEIPIPPILLDFKEYNRLFPAKEVFYVECLDHINVYGFLGN